jgi:membrane-associated phospholipid phosphatase
MTTWMNLFDEFGNNGPLFLIILSVYLLWNQSNLLFFYIFGIFCDFILNIVLKGIVKQPRPCFNSRELHLALKNNKRFVYKDGIPFDLFGMPSGHAQSCLYSTVFIYLAFRKTNWLYFYLLISAIIMSQRVVFKYHTFTQVIVGAPIGALFGYIMYRFTETKLKNHIREKQDDFGPI